MELVAERITNKTRADIRTVTFIYGEMRIIYRVAVISADSPMFADLFSDISCNNFEVDISTLKNIDPRIYVTYLDSLGGNYTLTIADEYALLPWTESRMITVKIAKRVSDLCGDKPNAIKEALEFIKFIMNNDKINGYQNTFATTLMILAAKPLLTINHFENESPEVQIYILELYYTFSSVRVRISKKFDFTAYKNNIFGDRKTLSVIIKHYMALFGYTWSNNIYEAGMFNFQAKCLIRAPSFDILRAHLLCIRD